MGLARTEWKLMVGLLVTAATGGPALAQTPAATPAPARACGCVEEESWWQRCQSRWRSHGNHGPKTPLEVTTPSPQTLHVQEKFLGLQEEFQARQLGSSVYDFGTTQVANGAAARMVLYHCDFIEGSNQLTWRGQDQLAKIALLASQNGFPVIIERTPCASGLDESRRWAIINEINHCAMPISPERVVVGVPIANGLSGVETVLVNQNLLNQTLNFGLRTGGGGGGGTAGTGR